MRLIVSHPTGNTFVRALVNYAAKQELISAFYTTINWSTDNPINNLLPNKYLQELSRRSYGLDQSMIRLRPFREFWRLFSGRFNIPCFKAFVEDWASLDSVYKDLDSHVAKRLSLESPSHVHCYEDGALETFKTAKELGTFCSYELPIAHWKKMHKLLRQEAIKRPEWSKTLLIAEDSPEKLQRKDLEMDLADLVIVPSEFVRDSLPQNILNTKRIVVSPFGSPDCVSSAHVNKPYPSPVRFLFVGSMGQRKGLADGLDAFSRAKRSDIELIILGSPMCPMDFYRNQYSNFIYEKPRAHTEVLKLMKSCHVLILPSIVEGRALVQQEAMSQQMALLVTPNAGGEDLIIEDVTGRLVSPSCPDMLLDAIYKFADNPKRTYEMGIEALEYSRNYTWEKYSSKITKAIGDGCIGNKQKNASK